MAHRLDFSRGYAAIAYRGETPWHGLGSRMESDATIEEWQRAAGLDYRILRGVVRYATARDADGNPAGVREMPDRIVNFRSDTLAPLAVVSDDYKPVQPRETLEFFRDCAESVGWQIETAGALFGGKRYWALARVTEDQPILDSRDRVGGFCLFTSSADGTLATTIRRTTIRVVCHNTLSAATRTGGKKAEFALRHTAQFKADDAKEALGLMDGDAREEFAQAMDDFRRLAALRVSAAETVDLTLRAFGHDPDSMGKKALDEALENRNVASVGALANSSRMLVGAQLAGGSGTAWGWLNAVTQFADHHAPARSRDNRLDSAWNGRGDTLKRRALELVMERVGSAPATVTTYDDAPAPGLLDSVLSATVAA